MTVFALKVSDEMLTATRADRIGFHEWTDKHGFVIVAASEAEARALAAAEPEGSGPWWTDMSLTSCEIVDDNGLARVIMANEPTG
jgi:hypothetical protein